MKYIVTDLYEGRVSSCTAEEANELRHCEDFFVVMIDHDKRESYWLTFEDEVLLND